MNVSGNICADAIVRNVNGAEVLNFSVASNRRYKTATGETKEETTFIYCQLWGKTEAKKLLYKGRAINVVGFFNVRNHVGSDGVLRPFYNVRVTSFQVFGKKQAEQPTLSNLPAADGTETNPTEEVIEDLPF